MNGEQRVLMLMCGEATPWDSFCARLELACSPTLRKQRRRLDGVVLALGAVLADPDDPITIRTRTKRPRVRHTTPAAVWLLGLLAVVIFVEYRTFTVPALVEWFKTMMHRCGL